MPVTVMGEDMCVCVWGGGGGQLLLVIIKSFLNILNYRVRWGNSGLGEILAPRYNIMTCSHYTALSRLLKLCRYKQNLPISH